MWCLGALMEKEVLLSREWPTEVWKAFDHMPISCLARWLILAVLKCCLEH